MAGCACNAGSGRYEAGLSCAVRRTDGNRLAGSPSAAVREQAVNEVKLYMEQNYADPAISLTTLAERVGLSPSYLGQVFSRQLGCPVWTILQRSEWRRPPES